MPDERETCYCPDGADCPNFAFGYPWCRPCEEHHRPPECAIDQQGRSLSVCGCPWEDGDIHRPDCPWQDGLDGPPTATEPTDA